MDADTGAATGRPRRRRGSGWSRRRKSRKHESGREQHESSGPVQPRPRPFGWLRREWRTTRGKLIAIALVVVALFVFWPVGSGGDGPVFDLKRKADSVKEDVFSAIAGPSRVIPEDCSSTSDCEEKLALLDEIQQSVLDEMEKLDKEIEEVSKEGMTKLVMGELNYDQVKRYAEREERLDEEREGLVLELERISEARQKFEGLLRQEVAQ